MSILIKGMEMPEGHPLWIIVHSDGTVEASEVSQSRPVGWQTLRNAAVSISPHGDLIDRDVAYDKIAEQEGGNYVDMDAVDMGLNETPTIIPAEDSKLSATIKCGGAVTCAVAHSEEVYKGYAKAMED